MEQIKKIFSIKYFVLLLVIVFCTRYIPIDSRAGVSYFKVAVACLCPLIALQFNVGISKAHIISLLYFSYILFTVFALHPDTFRVSTILYLLSFLLAYSTCYTFLYKEHCLPFTNFFQFIRLSIIIITIVLCGQQILLLIGVNYFPLLNMGQILNRGIGANSLFGEPSVFARVQGVLFYCYLKCYEYRDGKRIGIDELFEKEHKWVVLAFLWSMLTMGSGTAFVCMAVISLYFLKGLKIILALPIFAFSFVIMSYMGFDSFERARNVAIATVSGDSQDVEEVDGSAAVRIKPILNTLSIDLTDPEIWFGKGCDSQKNKSIYSDKRYLSGINDFGLIAYLLSLILVFSCAIRFASLPTIMFFLGLAGGTNNIPYLWGLLMLLTCMRYFSDNRDLARTEENNDEIQTFIIY